MSIDNSGVGLERIDHGVLTVQRSRPGLPLLVDFHGRAD